MTILPFSHDWKYRLDDVHICKEVDLENFSYQANGPLTLGQLFDGSDDSYCKDINGLKSEIESEASTFTGCTKQNINATKGLNSLCNGCLTLANYSVQVSISMYHKMTRELHLASKPTTLTRSLQRSAAFTSSRKARKSSLCPSLFSNSSGVTPATT